MESHVERELMFARLRFQRNCGPCSGERRVGHTREDKTML